MIERELYMKQIRPYIDKPFVKVLTGIRRCGKSSILMLLRDELLKKGASPENILYVNFEMMDNAELASAGELHAHVENFAKGEGKYYLFFDEVQEVDSWERAINSFLAAGRYDIYITGSNSRLLSSELATYIAGRYVEIGVSTLSFAEYRLFEELRIGEKGTDVFGDFKRYVRFGGFPVISMGEYDADMAYRIVSDIYASAILRDTVQRHGIRNIELLERVVKYVFDNIGNTFSAKNVADYFKSQQRRVDLNTVYNYLHALESAFIVSRVQRYDIKGRDILQTLEKYYVADQSLVYALMGYRDRMISGVLENVVMRELARRGYAVYVGKLGNREIDFIAERRGEKLYVQVSYMIGGSQETLDREFSPLLEVRDNYPKFVLSMDDFWSDDIEGVRHMHIADFLLRDEWS